MDLNVEDLLGAYHKLIMDPVHGGIPLLRHEVAIVDHPLFQRLRFICQNDILSLVFPGATHSRFLHSVGAMHVGGRMFMAMIENALKREARHQTARIAPDTLEAISYFHRLVRCACLLHDSGHCSFSHQFSRTPAIRSLLAKPDRFESLWQGIDIKPIHDAAPELLEHEHYSVRVAYEILSDIDRPGQTLDPLAILSLMETTRIEPSAEFSKHAHALWPMIQQSSIHVPKTPPADFPQKLQTMLSGIVSGELDADRADYMLRDGFHSSVTIGGFNLDHLLSNLHLGWCEQTGWTGLAIAEKGLGSLEDFVYSRHQMYRQVYAHKTAQGFDWLLRAAIDEVLAQTDNLTFVDDCLSDIHQFKNLTDNYFWEAFRLYAQKHRGSYAQCILERLKMPHIATRLNLSQEEEQTYIRFLAQENKIETDQIVASSITARFTRIRDDFSDIKVLSRGHDGNNHSLRLIAKTSQFFAKFTDDRITHFYVNPLHSHQSDIRSPQHKATSE